MNRMKTKTVKFKNVWCDTLSSCSFRSHKLMQEQILGVSIFKFDFKVILER